MVRLIKLGELFTGMYYVHFSTFLDLPPLYTHSSYKNFSQEPGKGTFGLLTLALESIQIRLVVLKAIKVC